LFKSSDYFNVVCIENCKSTKEFWPITIGKHYQIKSGWKTSNIAFYNIIADDGKEWIIPSTFFKYVDEVREIKIEEILTVN